MGVFSPTPPPFRLKRSPAPAAKADPGTLERKGVIIHDPSRFWREDGTAWSSLVDGGTVTTRKAYAVAVACYACITYRVQKLTEAPLLVMEEDEQGDFAWVERHELEPLLEEPNPDQDMHDLLEETQTYLDIDGKALWLKIRDRMGRVVALRCYAGDEFEVKKGEDAKGTPRLLGRFEVQRDGGVQVYGPEDVVFFRYFDPNNRQGGLSPTDAILSHLQIGDELRKRIKFALRNAALPSGLMSVKSEVPMTDDQFDRAKVEVNAMMGGVANTGKIALVENAEFIRTAMSLDEMKFGDLWREVEAAACMAFRVRPEIIGALVGLENSPWSHMDTARRLSYEDGIEPLWEFYGRKCTRQLLRPVESDRRRVLRFDRSKIRALQDDMERQARIGRLGADVLSDNERRAMLGREPLDGEEYDKPRLRQPAPLATPAVTEEAAKAREAKSADTAWILFDAVTQAQEFSWLLAAGGQLEADRQRVLALAESTLREGKAGPGPAEAKDDDDPFAPADAESVRALMRAIAADAALAAAWQSVARPLIESTARQAVQRVAAEMGFGFDLLQPGLLEYVEKHAAELVTQVTDTTRKTLKQALADGLEAGESVQKIAQRIRESAAFGRERAELIARTETTSVTNGAARESLESYQAASGNRIRKTWLSARDSRVRDEHRALDGESRPVDEPFSNGLQAPGEPNCRCTTIFALEEG